MWGVFVFKFWGLRGLRGLWGLCFQDTLSTLKKISFNFFSIVFFTSLAKLIEKQNASAYQCYFTEFAKLEN